ncbi:endolytic transglycosylase MltG [Lactococcus chungangensis]|uniref:endolytic transglycosylase MltG n=1 Tax=Pseudolactococcus chungangensis TaxID=451457 RepID=UPI003736A52B
MVEKDTKKFERETFKDKILRQLEEASQSLDDVASETGFATPKKTSVTPKSTNRSQDSDYLSDPSTHDGTFDETERPFRSRSIASRASKELSAESEFDPAFQDVPDSSKAFGAPERRTSNASFNRGEEDSLKEDTAEIKNIKRVSRQSQESYTRSAKKKSKKLAGKIIAIVVLVLFVVGGATGFLGYRYVKSEIQPYSLTDKSTKAIDIPIGAASKEIGQILEKNHIIKNATAFQYYTKLKSLTGFKSGFYNLSPSMTLKEIAKTLQVGGTEKPVEPVLGKITIPEGYTIDQMAEKISDNVLTKSEKYKTPFTKEEFLKVVTDSAFIEKMKTTYPELFESLPASDSGVKYQLEGYLFPATYEYTKKSTMASVVEQMIAVMNQNLQTYYATIKAKNQTVNEILSIAALTEKEANNDADRRNVAQVFYNRMNVGMTLGSNISILYAEGKLGQKTTLAEDAAVNTSLDSPFNLYLHQGYGPGPVTSPSLSAIKAAVEPTDNNDLYFVADVTTGKVYFSETQAEHDANVQKYVNDKLDNKTSDTEVSQ